MRSSSVSQRSSSAQKTRVKVRSKTPKRDDAARPTWDDTANDLNKYKLTPEEQVRRKAARQSRNRVLPPTFDAHRRSYIEAWASGAGASDVGDSIQGRDTSPCHSTGTGSMRAGGNAGIDYARALRMIEASSPQDKHTNSPPAAQPEETKHESCPQPQSATAMADMQQGAWMPAENSNSRMELTFMMPGQDAAHAGAPAGSGTEAPPSHAVHAAAQAECSIGSWRWGATEILGDADGGDDPLHGDISGVERTGLSRDDAVARPKVHTAAPMVISTDPSQLDQRFGRMVNATTSIRSELEARVFALERMLGQGEQGQHLHAARGTQVASDILELRIDLRRVHEEHASLRAELSSFSAHATTLLARLQAQLTQLLTGSINNNRAAGNTTAISSAHAAAAPSLRGAFSDVNPREALTSTGLGPGLLQAMASSTSVLQPAMQHSSAWASELNMPSAPLQPAQRSLQVAFAQEQGPVRRSLGGLGGDSQQLYVGSRQQGSSGLFQATTTSIAAPALSAAAAAMVNSSPQPVQAAPLNGYKQVPVSALGIDEGTVPLALPSYAAFRQRAAGAAAFTSRPNAAAAAAAAAAASSAASGMGNAGGAWGNAGSTAVPTSLASHGRGTAGRSSAGTEAEVERSLRSLYAAADFGEGSPLGAPSQSLFRDLDPGASIGMGARPVSENATGHASSMFGGGSAVRMSDADPSGGAGSGKDGGGVMQAGGRTMPGAFQPRSIGGRSALAGAAGSLLAASGSPRSTGPRTQAGPGMTHGSGLGLISDPLPRQRSKDQLLSGGSGWGFGAHATLMGGGMDGYLGGGAGASGGGGGDTARDGGGGGGVAAENSMSLRAAMRAVAGMQARRGL